MELDSGFLPNLNDFLYDRIVISDSFFLLRNQSRFPFAESNETIKNCQIKTNLNGKFKEMKNLNEFMYDRSDSFLFDYETNTKFRLRNQMKQFKTIK